METAVVSVSLEHFVFVRIHLDMDGNGIHGL